MKSQKEEFKQLHYGAQTALFIILQHDQPVWPVLFDQGLAAITLTLLEKKSCST